MGTTNHTSEDPGFPPDQREDGPSEIYHHLFEGQFRVIKLLPGDEDDPIHCELEVHQLGTPEDPQKYGCPPYEAISYVWGDPKDIVGILVGPARQTLLVTRNLLNALKVFRYPDKARTMWADAICVNQADLIERGRQVAIMGGIFSACEECNVWLGHADEYDPSLALARTNQAMRAEGYHEACTKDLDMPSITSTPDLGALARALEPWMYKRGLSLPNIRTILTEDDMGSLINVLTRTWWYRLWTLQEVILPLKHRRPVSAFVGSQRIDMGLFISLDEDRAYRVAWLTACYAFRSLPCKVKQISHMLFQSLFDIPKLVGQPGTWRHLLILTYRVCTDPRDAIHALSGISHVRLIDGTPDYTESVNYCYSRATKTMISRAADLEHLLLINPVLNSTSRPSCAIDFSKGLNTVISQTQFELRTRDDLRALDTDYSRTPPDILPVRARFLTTLSKVLPCDPANSSLVSPSDPASSYLVSLEQKLSMNQTLMRWYQAAIDTSAPKKDFSIVLGLTCYIEEEERFSAPMNESRGSLKLHRLKDLSVAGAPRPSPQE